MNTNTILRKSSDNLTTGNPLQSLQYKEIKVKKAAKTDVNMQQEAMKP